MSKILIYEPDYTGHHSEYINNILTYLQFSSIDTKVYFAFHSKIEDMLNLRNRKIPNVEYIILPTTKKTGIFRKFFYQLSEIKSIVNKLKINRVILLNLNSLFVSLALCKYNFFISGIIFNTYNPNYENYSFFKRISKELYYGIVCKRRMIRKLFILNDEKSCEYLNKHFHTDKFHYLPDPIPYYEKEELSKEIVGIKKERKIALHFGIMSERKGTFLILDTIAILPVDIIKKVSFFFIGKPCSEVFEVLLKNKIDQLKAQIPNISIYYYPNFVSSGQMESYYELSDFVLMPYISNNMSSGVLGHAAKHNKPVITGRGLLGEIVKEYDLGLSIDISIENLNKSIQKLMLGKKEVTGIQYVKKRNINLFVKTLFET